MLDNCDEVGGHSHYLEDECNHESGDEEEEEEEDLAEMEAMLYCKIHYLDYEEMEEIQPQVVNGESIPVDVSSTTLASITVETANQRPLAISGSATESIATIISDTLADPRLTAVKTSDFKAVQAVNYKAEAADVTTAVEQSKIESLRIKPSARVEKAQSQDDRHRDVCTKLSATTKSPAKDLFANPLYVPSSSTDTNAISLDSSSEEQRNSLTSPSSSSSSDEMSDDGIVVVAVKKRGDNAPIVVISDSDDEESGGSGDDYGDVDNDTEQAEMRKKGERRNKKSRGLTELEKTFGEDYRSRPAQQEQLQMCAGASRKKSFYKENYGSEDSCSSSSSLEIVENESRMSLNIQDGSVEVAVDSIFQSLEDNTTMITPHKWTCEMKRYYNGVVRGYATADLASLTSGMDRHANSWRVDRIDVYGGAGIGQRTNSRYFGSRGRCNNCNEIGHLARECVVPQKEVRCYMCGAAGHRETRCPENACLRCGKPGLGFQSSCFCCRKLNQTECQECGFMGHLPRDCPDIWRRFHLTLEGDDPQSMPAGSDKHPSDTWCCNCGRRGHLVDECRRFAYSPYPRTSLRVVSYAKVAQAIDKDLSPVEGRLMTRRQREKAAAQAERRLLKRKQFSTCPNSPEIPAASAVKRFRSVANSPLAGPSNDSGLDFISLTSRKSSSHLLAKAAAKLAAQKSPAAPPDIAGATSAIADSSSGPAEPDSKERLRLKRRAKRERKKQFRNQEETARKQKRKQKLLDNVEMLSITPDVDPTRVFAAYGSLGVSIEENGEENRRKKQKSSSKKSVQDEVSGHSDDVSAHNSKAKEIRGRQNGLPPSTLSKTSADAREAARFVKFERAMQLLERIPPEMWSKKQQKKAAAYQKAVRRRESAKFLAEVQAWGQHPTGAGESSSKKRRGKKKAKKSAKSQPEKQKGKKALKQQHTKPKQGNSNKPKAAGGKKKKLSPQERMNKIRLAYYMNR